MEHRETRKICPDGRSAVLFVHGICGTPNHFRKAIDLESLVPENRSVVNLRLPGHGGTVKDFARSSGAAWEGHVRDAFHTLALEHDRIYLVGHSMGTLFCLQLAAEYPEKVAGLFLLNVPMRPFVRPCAIAACLRLCFGKLREGKPREMALKAACGITPTRKLWEYIPWVPRFLDLFVLIRRTRKILPSVTVPAQAWQSGRDELVHTSASKPLMVYDTLRVYEMPDSSHFYYTQEDTERLCAAFRKFLGC